MSYLHFFAAFRDTIIAYAVNGGYLALFFSLVLEGIPLIGVAVPGHVAVISAGFLSATHVLNIYWVIIIGMGGALLGDYMSYSLGKRYGWPLIERFRPYFFISDSVVARTKTFLETHVGKALVLGRFNPVTRGLLSFLVGANHMPLKPFWIWNFIGASAWVGSSIIAGYALGLGFNFISGWVSRAVLVAIIASILILWGYRFVNRRFHIFKKYELFVLGLNLVSLFILFKMIEDSFTAEPFTAAFDLFLNNWINSNLINMWGGILVTISSWLSAFGGTVMVMILTVIGGVIFAGHKKWRTTAVLLMSIGSTGLLTGWLKEMIMRVRPENFITDTVPSIIGFLFDKANIIAEPSFPSGHAAFSAAFLVAIAYLTVPKIKHWINRELFIVAAVILGVAVGCSRLVLSVHWASDVAAGWALGIFCATASILFVRYVGAIVNPEKILKKDITGHS